MLEDGTLQMVCFDLRIEWDMVHEFLVYAEREERQRLRTGQ